MNNAGIIKRIPMPEMTAAEFRQVIDVDLNALFIAAKSVLPGMIEKNKGKIINICSEFGQYNIQCNGIVPGYIEPRTAPLGEKRSDGTDHPFHTILPVDKAAKFVEKYSKEATTTSPTASPFRHIGEELD